MKKFKEKLEVIGEILVFLAILLQMFGYLTYRYLDKGVTFGLIVGIIFFIFLALRILKYVLCMHCIPGKRYFRVRIDGHDFYSWTVNGEGPNTERIADHETYYVEEISKIEFLKNYLK